MEHPIGALPRTPFPASRDFAPVGSMSLDFQVASLSYKSSSFATSRGNEKIGGTGYCVTYDTDSQSRNASCVPFRGRGPRSGEGVDGGKNDYDILILCLIPLKGKRLTTFCASLRSGGRRLAVRTAKEHPIGALPCTPFASSRRSPQGETRSMERKNRESYISCTIPQFPPLVVNAVSQSPECVSCHMTQKVNSRNADFVLIAPKGDTTTLGPKGRQT